MNSRPRRSFPSIAPATSRSRRSSPATQAGGRRSFLAAAGISLLAGLLMLAPAATRAGGPFLVNGNGEPLTWDSAQPLPYNLDGGTLGQLDGPSAAALVAGAFGIWAAAPNTDLSFVAGTGLPCDVDASNFDSCGPQSIPILGVGDDGLSPVIYDTDGSIIELIFGLGSADLVIGFASVTGGSWDPPLITEAETVINGRFYDGVDEPGNRESPSQEAFQAVIVHELGHWLNLEHSQINLEFAADGDPANDIHLPTMFPTATDDDEPLLSLNPDDVAAIASLYPLDPLFPDGATVRGELFLPDGVTPFQGANLVLRSQADPLTTAYSSISGDRFFSAPPPDRGVSLPPFPFGGPPDPALEGSFAFQGVAPGTYTLEVEEIDPLFVGGSSAGPFSKPVFVPGPNEFWNGAGESSDPGIDDASVSAPLDLSAGEELSGVDIIMNDLPAPALLYLFDDEPFDPNDAGGPGTIIELDLVSGQILKRMPSPSGNRFALAVGLAYAAGRSSLFFVAGNDIFEIDPFVGPVGEAPGRVLNSFVKPAGAGTVDGLAFLEGPDHPPGGRLYALDSSNDTVLALDPSTGTLDPTLTLLSGSNLFGALGGAGDDLFVTSLNQIFHLRPADIDPLANIFPKPDLPPGVSDFNLLGLALMGDTVYATSTQPQNGEFPVWLLAGRPATDGATPTSRLDVLERKIDPTPVPLGGFPAAAAVLRGDLDGTGRVDGFDLATLARSFGLTAVDPGFIVPADLDRDDSVGGIDLAILAEFFGRSLFGEL